MYRGHRANYKHNRVKIGDKDLNNYGLYVDPEYEFNFPGVDEELEIIPLKGINSTYTRHVRFNDRVFSIDFNIMFSSVFALRLENIYNILDTKGILTVNDENEGFKIKRSSVEIKRGALNKIVINFVCEPFMYRLDTGEVIPNR